MQRHLVLAALVLTLPSLALAHIGVRPRESKPGAEERYTVRVTTEGAVATTHVQLHIPAGVTVLEVAPADGATFETVKEGDRITAMVDEGDSAEASDLEGPAFSHVKSSSTASSVDIKLIGGALLEEGTRSR